VLRSATASAYHPIALAALVVGVALALPGQARAFCGRHVHLPGEQPAKPHPQPCTGPNCSAHHESLPATPAAPAPVLDQPALLAGSLAWPADPGHRLAARSSGGRPIHRVFPPEPPPRIPSAG
jgi:hypothetical protein